LTAVIMYKFSEEQLEWPQTTTIHIWQLSSCINYQRNLLFRSSFF